MVRPHLFTNAEVHGLLTAIGALPAAPTSPFRRENLRLAVMLLYTTGLRLGELVRLTLGDYDPREHTLLIRDSKFHKSRLVPLSIDGTREIDKYLEARRSQRIAISPESPLLWHHTRRGTAYTGTGLTNAIRPLLRGLQIPTETGRLPRVHDFRHTFALEALLRWYRYRDAFVLLLRFVAAQRGVPVSELDLNHVGPQEVLDFLQHLEAERHSVPATETCASPPFTPSFATVLPSIQIIWSYVTGFGSAF